MIAEDTGTADPSHRHSGGSRNPGGGSPPVVPLLRPYGKTYPRERTVEGPVLTRTAASPFLMQPAIDLTARLPRLGNKLREGLPPVA